MTTQMCDAVYVRFGTTEIQCTYIVGHSSERHSWQTLLDQDEADKEAAAEAAKTAIDTTPTFIQAVINGIMDGTLDEYIEAILSAGHHRKRAKHGDRTDLTIRLPGVSA